MKSQLEFLGQWPVSGPEARRNKQMAVIRRDEALDLIHGKNNHVLVSFYVSNDFIHVGTMTIGANQVSDFEQHEGDEVFYVIQGTVSVLIGPDQEQKESLSSTRFEVGRGQRFFIPEGIRHQYLNYTEKTAKILFSIAPKL
jgi:mannose-6-phosphate isomerase-like protein (cupin superfamily)